MELIIIIVIVVVTIIVNSIMKINIKKLKEIALDTELNEITKKYPNNKEICNKILTMIGNNKTKIEENIKSEATIYIAIQDKILIGNTYESFSRIQTIAHECLHSIQDKSLLIFNFIFSNIYFLYFFIICLLLIIKKLPNELMFLNIFLILSFVYYVVRIFLENDAMIKAEYLAKDYMYNCKISTDEEIEKISNGFKKLNKECIKGTNCLLFTKIMIKVLLFTGLALIF